MKFLKDDDEGRVLAFSYWLLHSIHNVDDFVVYCELAETPKDA